MNTPRDVDLFLALWNVSANDDESCQPGSKEWDLQKKRLQKRWLNTWIDCKSLCAHIAVYENLIASARQVSVEAEMNQLLEASEDEPVA